MRQCRVRSCERLTCNTARKPSASATKTVPSSVDSMASTESDNVTLHNSSLCRGEGGEGGEGGEIEKGRREGGGEGRAEVTSI